MSWDQNIIERYHLFAKKYISTYKQKIDCADLAIASLVDFAEKNRQAIKLKYYSGGWKWYLYNPSVDDAGKYKRKAMTMLGTLNVIDNTKMISIGVAKPGDLIMSKWSGTLGHTRIIYSVTLDAKSKKYQVVWYQGNLPPVVPEKKIEYFSSITGVYKNQPRRWHFDQFSV